MDYNLTWYIILGILLVGYAILDGFDFGVGILHLFVKGDHNRRILMNSIGPVWDGNEVWLITAGGALFAGFPHVYATSFSSFYLPFMVLLFALIFRAVSLEFRSKEESGRWRGTWDFSFFFGSLIASFSFGLIIGNIITGIPIGSDKEFQGTLIDLFNPYAIIVGAFNVVLFALQGATYLLVKTDGKLQQRIRKLAKILYAFFVIVYLIITGVTIANNDHMIANFSFGTIPFEREPHDFISSYPVFISIIAWTVVLLSILAIANIARCIYRGKDMQAFLSSSLNIAALISLFGLGIFPNLLISDISPDYNLHIYNSMSSDYTLRVMLVMAALGMPFVITYTSIIYWTYRGKTRLSENSY